MPGAARFLYGLALGLSLGIIGSKLVSAASPGPKRQAGRNGRSRTTLKIAPERRERQEATVR